MLEAIVATMMSLGTSAGDRARMNKQYLEPTMSIPETLRL